jgi:hypothetical protein
MSAKLYTYADIDLGTSRAVKVLGSTHEPSFFAAKGLSTGTDRNSTRCCLSIEKMQYLRDI